MKTSLVLRRDGTEEGRRIDVEPSEAALTFLRALRDDFERRRAQHLANVRSNAGPTPNVALAGVELGKATQYDALVNRANAAIKAMEEALAPPPAPEAA